MAMRTTFLPCPFCGNKTVTLEKLGYYSYVVRCKECYAKTSVCETEYEAEAAWNRRFQEVLYHDQMCNITQRKIMGVANGPIGGCNCRLCFVA